MKRRMVILVAVALLATMGGAGCGDETTAPVDQVPQDTAPPAAVTGLELQLSPDRNPNVVLRWNAGAELDLAGYNVYRALVASESDWPQSKRSQSIIASGMSVLATVTDALYLDDSVQFGETYRYAVSAVDESGNESGLVYTESVSVEAEPPRGTAELRHLN